MTQKLKLKILKTNDVVKFIPLDKTKGGENLGRAEFDFCVKWKNGKIKEVYIFHRQQHNIEYYYKIEVGFATTLQFSSRTFKGIQEPKLWYINYCKKHKAINHQIYVPSNSNQFTISLGSIFKIDFDKS